MALRWLRVHPTATVPPMDLPSLVAESNLERPVCEAIGELVAAKTVTHELGEGSAPPVIELLIADELRLGEQFDHLPLERDAPGLRREADRFFRSRLDALSG